MSEQELLNMEDELLSLWNDIKSELRSNHGITVVDTGKLESGQVSDGGRGWKVHAICLPPKPAAELTEVFEGLDCVVNFMEPLNVNVSGGLENNDVSGAEECTGRHVIEFT